MAVVASCVRPQADLQKQVQRERALAEAEGRIKEARENEDVNRRAAILKYQEETRKGGWRREGERGLAVGRQPVALPGVWGGGRGQSRVSGVWKPGEGGVVCSSRLDWGLRGGRDAEYQQEIRKSGPRGVDCRKVPLNVR